MGMAARAFASGRVTCTSCTLHARRCLAFQHPPHPQYHAAVTHGVRDASSTGVFAQGKSWGEAGISPRTDVETLSFARTTQGNGRSLIGGAWERRMVQPRACQRLRRSEAPRAPASRRC
ncbi:hypothetical protein DO70_4651 [Burkholderia pseudomallei]|nr:hypothetical protein DO70_4651 [Burkholderia pseudomallei]